VGAGGGYVIKLAGAAVSWCSRKQPTLSLSTQEAEYKAGAETTMELVWLRLLLSELGFMQGGSTALKMDNTAAIATATGTGSAERRKHIDIKYHYIKEKCEDKTIKLAWIPSDQNQADLFTKPLTTQKFCPFRDQIMGQPQARR
jgi:hypothetical protein